MIRQNLHTHTVFDDGGNTVMEMARAAADAGLTSLGFSGHSILPYENDWAMNERTLPLYRAAVAEARDAFAGRLRIYLGLEWDLLSAPPEGFDYVIGSVHHLTADGEIFSADESPEASKAAVARHYAGDPEAFAEAYYSYYEELARAPFADVVGHLDLLTKFDEREHIFDACVARCRDAAMAALETLVKADKLFEVNTGAMSRGWRTSPYPAGFLLRELRARRARVLVTSDAHSTAGIAWAFPETEELLRSLGFRERWELTDDGFFPVPL